MFLDKVEFILDKAYYKIYLNNTIVRRIAVKS